MNGYLNPVQWLRGLIKATLRARPRVKLWEWMDANVVIPDESGGPHPGQMQSRRFPVFRGLCDLAQLRTTRYLALCASARVGKTLFSIGVFLYWIAERIGHVAWLDPSGQSAKKFVRNELEPFIQQCPAVWRLAIVSKTTWTTLWKTFRGKIARILGSGAEADLHGFNVELVVVNEKDRCRDATKEDASSAEKLIARTKLFLHTRLILENSTPGVGGEFSPIWRSFLRGSQHYCYLPCPHCSAAKAEELSQTGRLPGSGTPEKRQKGAAKCSKVGAAPAGSHQAIPAGWSELSMEPGLAGWQRLSFSVEKKLVPFDEQLRPLLESGPDGRKTGKLLAREKWREETTGQIHFEQFAEYSDRTSPFDATRTERVKVGYDMDGVERGTTYQCAWCGKDIEATSLRWMLARYRWVAHNLAVPADRISAHIWAAYSPFESWSFIAKEFLEARHDVAQLIKFTNLTCGLPFIRQGAAVKEDDLDRAIARTPARYVKGQLPMLPEMLTMAVDKQQQGERWYSIRAWGVLWDHPEQPTWSALIDWGQCHSHDEVLELAGLKQGPDGHLRRFVYTDPASGERSEHHVNAGILDAGFEPEAEYEFCARHEMFSPHAGRGPQHTRQNKIRPVPVLDGAVELLLCWSDYFAANLYYDCIKYGVAFGKPILWWLPTDIDQDYRKQLTDEYQGPEGWTTRTKTNHLGDTEKYHRVLSDSAEEYLQLRREARAEEIAAAAAGKG